jgi:hypothetical protein
MGRALAERITRCVSAAVFTPHQLQYLQLVNKFLSGVVAIAILVETLGDFLESFELEYTIRHHLLIL